MSGTQQSVPFGEHSLNIKVDGPTKKALERLAKLNDRTVAAELRRAIYTHLNGKA